MDRKSASQRIAAELEQMISIGEIKPGKRMDEQSLAVQFKVSRTPIREALKQLAARGILVPHGRRGLYLAEVGPEELAQMVEAMAELEFLCARLAAHRFSWLQRAELERLQQECLIAAEKEDRRAFIENNEKFHALIYQATQNQFLARIASEFRQKSSPFRSARLETKEQLIRAAQSHTRIVDLIIKAKSDGDFQALRDHIDESSRRILGSRSASV